MAAWSEESIHANGLDIHYHRTGRRHKPTVLLLHGVLDNGQCWTRVAHDLQDRFDLLMPDARGHGHTGGSLENLSYNLLAEDVAAFISALHLERPYLFGHSMGAMTAAVVAASYPDVVRALVMEDPPFVDAPSTERGKQRAAQAIGRMKWVIAGVRALPPALRIAAGRAFNPRWDKVDLIPWVESKVEFDLDILPYLQQVFPWREILPRITCPVLLVTGDPARHALVTPQAAQEAARLWQHGEVVQILGAGHSIHRDRYPETMQPVRDFLSRT
jgi:N-formylmaleamate deformylase